MDVDEGLLATKLEELDRLLPDSGDLRGLLESFVRTASDEELVRINPVAFAQRHGCEEAALMELFLHGRKVDLLRMEWHYVCPGCGDIVESFQSLTSATAHYFCQICSTDRQADLSDFIEITFSVSREIRQSRYHDPWSLSPEEYFFSYRFTANGVVDDGSPLREHLRRHAAFCAFFEPGQTITFEATPDPGYLWFTSGPVLIVSDDRTDESKRFAFDYTGTRSPGYEEEIAAGPVRVEFTNAAEERFALLVVNLPGDYEWSMQPFLSGAKLLSNQTFLDLFESETIVAAEGLAVKRLALLFTDIQGSTALYDRIGDMKAFDLVRLHFGHLSDSISRNSGALVKTIGDAVMASFHDPLDALRAALDMHAQIARFNAESGDDLIGLKVGVHVGTCLAVTLNGRLDYFGQAVNIAARVQALSEANEIYLTDEMLSIPGAEELLAAFATESRSVQLKGVQGPIRVHRVHPGSGRSVEP
ncbi:MAG: adenylate/guanylate cyclase domain-containing protein [Actinomycetota bacterium]|nr:adenylate/guanylate cyclase domain-containing protein [Actinomycetota bacterium]